MPDISVTMAFFRLMFDEIGIKIEYFCLIRGIYERIYARFFKKMPYSL